MGVPSMSRKKIGPVFLREAHEALNGGFGADREDIADQGFGRWLRNPLKQLPARHETLHIWRVR